MNRCYLQLFLLSVFIVAAWCLNVNDDESAKKSAEGSNVWPALMDDVKEESTGNFTYRLMKKSKYCILANMDIDISIPVKGENNTVLKVPKNATVDGTCSSVISELKLSWKGAADRNNMIKFTFINDHTDFSIFSVALDVVLNKDAGNSSLKGASIDALRLFVTPVKNGLHKCNEGRTIKTNTADVTFTNVSLIAFNTEDDISKREAKQCDSKAEDGAKTFHYVSKKNGICTMANMSITFDIPYKTKDSKDAHGKITVPSKVDVSGNCDSVSSLMKLAWTESSSKPLAENEKENYVTFVFAKNKVNSFMSTMVASIYMDEKNFPNATDVGKRVTVNTLLDHQLFLASAENGFYSCEKAAELTIDGVKISISDVLLIAFDAEKELASKRVTDCRYLFPEDSFNYKLYDKETGVFCTLAKMRITMAVPYETANSKGSKLLTVPSDATVSGVCHSKWPILYLDWAASSKATSNNKITLHITQNATDFFVYGVEATVILDEENFPGAVGVNKTVTGDISSAIFSADKSAGLYRCEGKIHELKLDTMDMNLTDVLFVAFNKDLDMNAKKVDDCAAQETTTQPPTESTTQSTTQLTTQPPGGETTPTPDPSVKEYNYVVTDPNSHIPCVLANMTIQLSITYKNSDSKEAEKTITVPDTAKTNGTCEDTTAKMILHWTPENGNEENNVTFTFKEDKSKSYLQSMDVDILLDEKTFPNAKEKRRRATTKEISVFAATSNNIYKCAADTVLSAGEVGIHIKNVSLIPFNTKRNVTSKTEEYCDTATTESDVGAIVGGIIGGAILLGIIVYVIMYWRRRRYIS